MTKKGALRLPSRSAPFFVIRPKCNRTYWRTTLESPWGGKAMTQPTLIIADDHPLFPAALKEAGGRHVPGERIVEASSLDTLRRAAGEYPDADLILLDLRMPGAKGFSSLLYPRAEHPAVPVIVVSASEDASVIQRALEFCASGVIPKSARIESIGESLD